MPDSDFKTKVLAGLVLWVLAVSVHAQMRGVLPGSLDNMPGSAREHRDLNRSQSNPGVAGTLDIRVQGEGLALPPGVSEDDRDGKPAAAPESSRIAPQADKPKPETPSIPK